MNMSSWRKLETDNGFPYYLNEASNLKQWDHPKYCDIKQRLDDCNHIKYSKYRVASKFRVLQQALYMDEVPLSTIAGVFDRHKLGLNEGSLCLDSYDLEAILSDIYFASNKQNHTNTDVDFATELMMNFLYNVYDKDRYKNISVTSTKLVLVVLSNYKLLDLYRFIFSLCTDHNHCATRIKLQTILTKFTEIISYMHEDVSFGYHLVNFSVEDCFSRSPGLAGMMESTFLSWLENSPPILSWLPTLYRMKAAETVVHAAKCCVCKATPLLGLRYRCVKCSNYIQCQSCFLSARINHSHKLVHPMKEYCTEGTTRDLSHMLVKKLCSFLRCSVRIDQPNTASSVVETKLLSDRDWLLNSSKTDSSCNIEPLSTPQAQLQVVIRQLELQNRELQQMLVVSGHNDREMKKYLEDHRVHVATQIKKLKVLKEYLQMAQPTHVNQVSDRKIVESTPIVTNVKTVPRGIGLDMLSPIAPIQEGSYCGSAEPVVAQNLRNNAQQEGTKSKTFMQDSSLAPYSMNDLSTWIGGQPSPRNDVTKHDDIYTNNYGAGAPNVRRSSVHEMNHDLDDVLAKLQQILANNFTLDESLGHADNGQLKQAVNEVEGMLTSLIDGVEHSRANSAQKGHV